MAKQLIWKLPTLKKPLSLEQLKKVVAMEVPIREMKLSHFIFTKRDAQKQIKDAVDFICDKMHLNAFCMDRLNYYEDENEKHEILGRMPLQSFKYCVQNLPIRNITIDCFAFNGNTQKFHEYLLGLGDTCPEIILSRYYRDIRISNLRMDTKEAMKRFVATRFPDSYQRMLDEEMSLRRFSGLD